MTGVFKLFANAEHGLAIGGHWEHPDENTGNLISSSMEAALGPSFRRCWTGISFLHPAPPSPQRRSRVGFLVSMSAWTVVSPGNT